MISQYFWPENFRINDLVLGLSEKGHNVTVLTGIPNYPQGKFFPGYGFFNKRVENYNGVRIIRVPLIPRGRGGTSQLIINYLSFTLCATLLGPLYCRGQFDLIFFSLSPFTEGIPAIIIKRIKKAPAIYWGQDIWPESLSATGAINSDFMLKMVRILIRCIYRGCDMILMQSRVFSSYIERDGILPYRIRYFPNSAEELYKPVTLEAGAIESTSMPSGFKIVFAGNIGAAQDFGTILSAAEQIKNYKDIHWVIIGEGRMRPWVEEEVKKRGLSETVHLIGRYPMETMPRFFALADVLLVTLKKEPIFALTIPGKIQSYLACARPIIAAIDGEGARVIEEAGAGLACPAGNPGSLAETVLRLYNMTADERDRMAQQGRSYFEDNFERHMLLNRLDNWISELCGVEK
ncbi:MAG TPA: glycosyltransferase family 4 protein [Syntrophales bacterium]|nr:glycosyltransferase family 4 protein [Syntrophales bacterium]